MIDNYITGSNGFLGQHLLRRLTGDTCRIGHDKIKTCSLLQFSRFFFLSTYGNMAGHTEIDKILRANVGDVKHILNEIAKLRFAPDLFLFVSSSSVNLPVQTSYSRTKLAAEHMILATGIPACIVRPYSIVGVGEQPQHLIPTLIRSCIEGEPMDFVPDATHDFVDVEDVADALITLADRQATGIFELGNGMPITNQEVLNLVERVTGKKANVTIVERLRPYDTSDWYLKANAARTDSRMQSFGWEPKKTLEQSITEMVTAYKIRVSSVSSTVA